MTDIAFPVITRTPNRMRWSLVSNTQSFPSPLSGAVQTTELPGARWRCQMTYDVLDEANASILQAWLMQLRGMANRALIYPIQRSVPRGTISTGGVTVSGTVAAQGNTVNLAGCGAAKTLLRGDFFSVGNELKMITADATADGSGLITAAQFEPPVNTSAGWVNAQIVTLSQPTCRMVQEQAAAEWSVESPVFSAHELAFIEVFT